MWSARGNNAIAVAFFLTLLVVGVWCHRDYGVTWDEFQQRATGGESLKYIVERIEIGRAHV